MPHRCIVAATDFSPTAERAVARAALIARQQGAELHLLHVTQPLTLYPGMAAGPGDTYAAAGVHGAAVRLGALAQVLREQYAIQVHIAQRIGRAHSQIAHYADTVDAELVVVGARGENAMLRLLLGATAWRLLRLRKGALLIVKNAASDVYRRLLAAVDFSPDSRAALAWAVRLTVEDGLDVLHVLPEEDEARLRSAGLDSAAIQQRRKDMRAIVENLMTGLLAELPVKATRHIDTGHYPTVQILACAAKRHSELIVLGRHGMGGLEEWLLGGVSKDVAQAAECDVLLTGC